MPGIPVLPLQGGGGNVESIIGAAFAFIVSFIIGTFAIHIGARLMVDRDTGYRRAVITALVGAVVWAVVAFFLGWIPLLGPFLALVAWVGVINWQYPGGWGRAAAIGFIAWVVAFAILYLLASLDLVAFDALGIPGA